MENALNLIQSWIDNSRWKVQVISRCDRNDNCDSLLGISEHSTLGTIINHVGGISAANGVIRHFGGNNKFNLSIKCVNQLSNGLPNTFKGVLIVADDIYGGLFGINHSLPIAKTGMMLYLPPDSYGWESLEIGHSSFVNWTMSGDVAMFYKKYERVPVESHVPFDKVLSFTPPLWTENVKTGKFTYTLAESSYMHKIRAQLLEQLP
jgi:hypothetical protein